MPSVFTAEDYPGYVKPGEKVETLGVQAVLAVYNWPRESDRFRRVSRFIDYYFERFENFHKPPYHPKWKSINLAAKVPGWTRYWVAEEKLKQMAAAQPAAPTHGRSRSWRASRRRARRPTMRPSRSACSRSSWSGASRRPSSERRPVRRWRERIRMGHEQLPDEPAWQGRRAAPRSGIWFARRAVVALSLRRSWRGGGARRWPRPARGGAASQCSSAIVAEAVVAGAACRSRSGPPSALPGNSFVRLRGLPPSVSLTEGHAIGPGSWAVPLFSLPTLKANIPAGVSGRSELIISLVAVDGTLLAEARTALVVGPSAMIAPADKATGTRSAPMPRHLRPPCPPGGPTATVWPRRGHPSCRPRTRRAAEKLIAQGERFLTQGNIASRAQFFQRAADAGYAPAAIRLAATYDPAELARLQVQGVVPDRAEAASGTSAPASSARPRPRSGWRGWAAADGLRARYVGAGAPLPRQRP